VKKTLILITSIITLIVLAGIVLGTSIIVKTNNPEFEQDASFYKALGDYFAEHQETSKAISMYEQSLSLGKDLDVTNNLAVLYHTTGNYKKAIEQVEELVEAKPENPSYHYDLAVNLVARFRNTEDKQMEDLYLALEEYELAERLEPGYENAKQNAEVIRQVLKI